MKKLAIRLGTWGAALGMLAGVVELSIGAHIRPWIGNKENPAVLGLVTILLSGLALAAFIVARKKEPRTNDGKLAIFLGALLPAAICFTTVGRLWYLPGALLLVAAALLAYEFWMTPQAKVSPGTSARTWRRMAGIGSLVILLSIGFAFLKSTFGLFHAEVLVMADRIRYDVLPMDFVRRTAISNGAMIHENVEAGQVMGIYLCFMLGAMLAFIASLTASRLFTRIGGGIAFLGLLLCLVLLPGILAQVHYAPGYPGLLKSLGWGWYISAIGTSLILVAGFLHPERSIQDRMAHSTLILNNKKEA